MFDDIKNAMKAPEVKLANLVGGVGATIWIITPAAIGALAGTLTKKFSASAGFMWGAMVGVAGVAAKVIRGFYTLELFPSPSAITKSTKDFHDGMEEATEAEQETARKEDISMTHAQRVANSKGTLRTR